MAEQPGKSTEQCLLEQPAARGTPCGGYSCRLTAATVISCGLGGWFHPLVQQRACVCCLVDCPTDASIFCALPTCCYCCGKWPVWADNVHQYLGVHHLHMRECPRTWRQRLWPQGSA